MPPVPACCHPSHPPTFQKGGPLARFGSPELPVIRVWESLGPAGRPGLTQGPWPCAAADQVPGSRPPSASRPVKERGVWWVFKSNFNFYFTVVIQYNERLGAQSCNVNRHISLWDHHHHHRRIEPPHHPQPPKHPPTLIAPKTFGSSNSTFASYPRISLQLFKSPKPKQG